MRVALGIDIGTTSTKVVVTDPSGAVLASAQRSAPTSSPQPAFAEMAPADWWHNLELLIPEVLHQAGASAREVVVVGVSGMVPTLIATDRHLDPLHPSIQQNDARASFEISQLHEAVPDALVRTGSAVTAQSIGPKWRWLTKHRPDVTRATTVILGSYGWVVAKLTGVLTCDENWALESGLAGISGGWDDGICAAAGVEQSLLPPILASNSLAGALLPDAAEQLGLVPGTPVTVGYADHVASAFGAGLLEPGDTLLKLGGAGDILVVTAAPLIDERLYLDHHPMPGLWLPNGCMASSGSLLRWFQRELADDAALIDLDGQAAQIAAGSGGLLALPYFLGEKTPVMDPLARGAFVGMHLGHTRAHMYRAILEAVCFGMFHHLQILAERGVPVTKIVVTNGGSRSALWKQTLADTVGLELGSIAAHPGSSWGAALLAAETAGMGAAADAVRARSTVDETFSPDPRAHRTLGEHYLRYGQLREALAPVSHSIATAWS